MKKVSRGLELEVLNPGLGLNNLISDALIKDTEASDLVNIEFVESGCPAKRRGCTQIGDTVGSNVKGIASYYKADGTKEFLAKMGTGLRKYNGAVWTAITGATLTDINTNFVQARDSVYLHNGTDPMTVYSGTTMSQPTTGVVGRFGIFYAGVHVVGGNSSFPSRIYLSNPANASDFTGSTGTATAGAASSLTDSTKAWGINDFAGQTIEITAGTGAGQKRTINSNTATVITVGTAWGTNPDNTSVYKIASGNFIDISKDDGDKITGLGKWGEYLIIFKERSTYQLSFDSAGIPIVKNLGLGVGCVAHRSIDSVDSDLYFLTRNGVRVLGNEPNYYNVIRTNELSARIFSEIDTISDTNLDKASAIYYDYKYLLSIPQGGATANNTVLVYDKRYTAWSKWTGMSVNSFNTFIDSTNTEGLYFGSDSDGKVAKMLQSYNDCGVAINSYWVSKNFDFKNFDRNKRFTDVTFAFRKIAGSVKVEFIVDGEKTIKTVSLGSNSASGGVGTDLVGYTVLGSDGGSTTATGFTGQSQQFRVRLNNKKGFQLKIKVSNSIINETFTLLGFKLFAKTQSHYSYPSSKRY